MGANKFQRLSARLESSQLRLRFVFLGLAAVTVALGLLLAVVIFVYLLRFTLHPAQLESLVDDWAALLVDATPGGETNILDPSEGPARWFAVVALLVLGFLLSRIPLLMIQMGTALFQASQDHQRQTKAILKEVLLEVQAQRSISPSEEGSSSQA
ncbi:hypothetical protein [Lyngbya confervoides]|uniref:Uncharacterized protein n=1 Tax=Lyngbya confervoides BDU141951 TaxID=1574623 RepID=A0ABD4T2L6_9CYAN|nr:hypothetical protein [Lyngbya confervoides]MCM1982774.1 hypothetical protein [Lyngbya confervoides BDU141951]